MDRVGARARTRALIASLPGASLLGRPCWASLPGASSHIPRRRYGPAAQDPPARARPASRHAQDQARARPDLWCLRGGETGTRLLSLQRVVCDAGFGLRAVARKDCGSQGLWLGERAAPRFRKRHVRVIYRDPAVGRDSRLSATAGLVDQPMSAANNAGTAVKQKNPSQDNPSNPSQTNPSQTNPKQKKSKPEKIKARTQRNPSRSSPVHPNQGPPVPARWPAKPESSTPAACGRAVPL